MMKRPALTFLAALVLGAGLTACGQRENEAETANAPAETTPANETAANANGTTTYYGSPEEQAQN